MGVLLLQGWAMMEACCEECNVPLMRSRDKKQELCVQCNKDFKAAPASTTKQDAEKEARAQEEQVQRQKNKQ